MRDCCGPRSVDGGRLQDGAHCLVVLLEAELVVEALRGVVLRPDHDEGDVAAGAHDLRQTLGQVDAEALAPVLGPRLHAVERKTKHSVRSQQELLDHKD